MADDPAQQDASEFSRWIGHNSSAIQRTPAQRIAAKSVENFPGAGSTIGTADGAKAAPDSYTLVLAGSGSLAISPTLYKELPYDPRKDFTPIALVVRVPFILVVNPSLPIESVADLISYAKAHPGALTYGSGGAGSPHQLYAEMFKTMTGIEMTHVPYKGSAPALTDVVGGHLLFADPAPTLPLIKAEG